MRHRHTGPDFTLHFHRLKAALSVQRRTICDLTKTLPVTHRHAVFVFLGERRGSAALYAAIRQELGEPAWWWVTGQTDALHDEGATHAA